MDSHNAGRNRGSVEAALGQIKAQTLVMGITSDVLFPPAEQKYLASNIKSARYVEIDSFYGHDGFLIETDILTKEIGKFLKTAETVQPVVVMHKIA
jgi:homoserine O-acetyltransferase